MDIKTYIESGILELYAAGSLSKKENQEVYEMMRKHPEILQEVLSIEAAIIKLTAAASGYTNLNGFQNIKNAIGFNADDKKVIPITKSKFNWGYIFWLGCIYYSSI